LRLLAKFPVIDGPINRLNCWKYFFYCSQKSSRQLLVLRINIGVKIPIHRQAIGWHQRGVDAKRKGERSPQDFHPDLHTHKILS
jgi:hypothetical protein